LHGITGGDWWRGAAIYELYVQSFADGNGDGLGDLAGVRERLPYLAALGIDAIWFTPWYPSPKSDAGYDVADYRSIDPAFGTLTDADALIADGHAHGIKTIIDIVPNHCSDRHPWFQAALAAAPGSAERARFWFRPGRGPGGELPPNNWRSIFGGPAWTRVSAPDGTPGEWYLHLFAPQQPDFNWANPEVRAEFEAVLRFWFDRGVDGIRIDSAALLTKDPRLPDTEPGPGDQASYTDRDDVHDIYRAWRAVAGQYPGRVLIGEVWLADAARLLEIDLATGKRKVITQDPQFDVRSTINNPKTNALEAVSYTRQRTEYEFIDPKLKADFEVLANVRQGDIATISPNLDDTRWIVGFVGDDSPVSWYVYDRASKKATFLFSSRPDLDSYKLATMKPIEYSAGDGLKIYGYLTTPPGEAAHNLPMVVFVHGGPWSRDTWGFNRYAQWLANRGYAVLEVNFRGSTGYGKKYLHAGDRQWASRCRTI